MEFLAQPSARLRLPKFLKYVGAFAFPSSGWVEYSPAVTPSTYCVRAQIWSLSAPRVFEIRWPGNESVESSGAASLDALSSRVDASRNDLQTAGLLSSALFSIEPQLQVKVNSLPKVLSAAPSAVDSPPMPPATKTPAKPTTAAPERSLVQRMEALQRANEIRTKRATLKRDLKAGKVPFIDLLLEPPDYVATRPRSSTCCSLCPKYGRVKVNKVLQLCRISPSKTIGGLSPRQRTELVSMLR